MNTQTDALPIPVPPADPAIFTEQFGSYVCHGDRITAQHAGFTLTAIVERDDSSDAPWDRECGHGEVSDWRLKTSKRAGERVLNEDGRHVRFYDFAGAIGKAVEEGWGLSEQQLAALTDRLGRKPTRKQIIAEAVDLDFKVLRAWCNDEWDYCGVCVTVSKAGITLTSRYDNALWGIERNYPGSDNSYLVDTANDLAGEALDAARVKLEELCACNGGETGDNTDDSDEEAGHVH